MCKPGSWDHGQPASLHGRALHLSAIFKRIGVHWEEKSWCISFTKGTEDWREEREGREREAVCQRTLWTGSGKPSQHYRERRGLREARAGRLCQHPNQMGTVLRNCQVFAPSTTQRSILAMLGYQFGPNLCIFARRKF